MKKAKVDWKNLSGKKKAEYIWDYYKIHILVGILVLSLGVYSVVKIVTHRDPLMSVIMLNCEKQSLDSQSVFEPFLTQWGYEVYPQAVKCHNNFTFREEGGSDTAVFESNLMEYAQLKQAYFALLYTKEYDIVMGNGPVFNETADGGAFADLREILSEESLETYAEYLIYTDEEGTVEKYPCGIQLNGDNNWLAENGLYQSCSVGVLKNAPNSEISARMIQYLLNEYLTLLD